MSIASGYKKFKKYILTSSGFQLVSHWTKANTLEFDDGKTAQDKLGAIDGISSSRESNSDKIAASTALVSELNSDLAGYQFRVNNGVPEYKAGADAVWVPFRQDPKLIASYNGSIEYGTITKTYTAAAAEEIIAIAMGVTGNDYGSAAYAPSTSANITGSGSISIAFNKKIYGNNTNLSRPGMGILSTYICTLKSGDMLTVSITPFESQFRSGYSIVFLQS